MDWVERANFLAPSLPRHNTAGFFLLELCKGQGILTYGAEPFLRSCQFCSHSRTSQHFMEPEGSLPCSQEPSTGNYPEPDPSSPYHSILSISDLFDYCQHTYVLIFLVERTRYSVQKLVSVVELRAGRGRSVTPHML
jgi:hypothetical protein